MAESTEQELHAEWRANMRADLLELKSVTRELTSAVTSIQAAIASMQVDNLKANHRDHEERLRTLESYAMKMTGIVFGVQAILAVAVFVLDLILRKGAG